MMKGKLPLALALAWLATAIALQAGEVTIVGPLTDDASTGVSSSKTYTHAISGGTAATLNGVNFEVLDAAMTPANFNWDTGGAAKNVIACCNNGDWVPATGGVTGPELINLLGSFTYSSNGDGNPSTQTFTLSGLAPGTTYDTRLYIRTWDTEGSGRPIDITFTNGAEVDSYLGLMQDRPGGVLGDGASEHSAYYLNYRFTAETSEMAIAHQVVGPPPSGSFHMYALSNEVVPEPNSLVLVSIALLGLLSGRRRRK
jgi:hypothetical protein